MFLARLATIGLITGLSFLGCWTAAQAQPIVIGGCRFGRVTGLNFGTYDPFSPIPLDTTGQVQFFCLRLGGGPPVTVQLSQGGSNSFTPRQMSSGSNRLNYNLYLDPNHSRIWGDGTGGTYPWVSSSVGLVNTLTIYGRIPAQQWVAPGLYTDSLQVTIIF